MVVSRLTYDMYYDMQWFYVGCVNFSASDRAIKKI